MQARKRQRSSKGRIAAVQTLTFSVSALKANFPSGEQVEKILGLATQALQPCDLLSFPMQLFNFPAIFIYSIRKVTELEIFWSKATARHKSR